MIHLVNKGAKLICAVTFSTVFLFCTSLSFSQIQSIETESKSIERLQQKKENLDKKIAQKLKILKKKSAEISKIKSGKSDNYFKRKKLQSLLQESKEVADQLNRLEAERETVRSELDAKTVAFRKLIDAELLSTFRITKARNKKSSEYKNGVKKLSNLFQLRAKYLPQNRGVPDYPNLLVPVRITALDDSQTVKEKMDLVKDQEDYLHSISLILREKIKVVKEWAGLTQVAGDLLEDIQVQQTRDETIGNASALTMGGTRAQADYSTESVKAAGTDQGDVLIPIELENIFKLKPEQLSVKIGKLEQMEKRIQSQADSLAKIVKSYR